MYSFERPTEGQSCLLTSLGKCMEGTHIRAPSFFFMTFSENFITFKCLTLTHFVRPQTLDVLNMHLTSQNSVVLQKTILRNDKGQHYVKCNKMQQKSNLIVKICFLTFFFHETLPHLTCSGSYIWKVWVLFLLQMDNWKSSRCFQTWQLTVKKIIQLLYWC